MTYQKKRIPTYAEARENEKRIVNNLAKRIADTTGCEEQETLKKVLAIIKIINGENNEKN